MAINDTLFNLKVNAKSSFRRLQNNVTQNYFGMRREIRIIIALIGIIIIFIIWTSLSNRIRTIEENSNFIITYNPKTDVYNVSIIQTNDLEATISQAHSIITPSDSTKIEYDIPAALTGKSDEYFDLEEKYYDEEAIRKRQEEYNEQKKIFENGPNVYE